MQEEICDFGGVENVIMFGATVATGFERVAMYEIKEKIDCLELLERKGKVFIKAYLTELPKLHKLRSVDKLFVIIKYFKDYDYPNDKEELQKNLTKLAATLPWENVEKLWKQNQLYCKKTNLKGKESIGNKKRKDADGDEAVRFRVTASRAGKKQCLTSPEAELHFGGHLQDATQWQVDLSNYNLEVIFSMGMDFLMVGLSLTLRSLHHRNISHFGKTTLRSTVAYNMLRLCRIKPGEVVLDAMCGSGGITIEGVSQWGKSLHIAGDNAHPAVVRCRSNIKHHNKDAGFSKFPVDVYKWDATNLPLRTASVDVCITDLPFGKRMGSHLDNRTLYPLVLREFARVSRPGTARACLLTHDKRTIVNALTKLTPLWKVTRTHFINVGGLKVGVYLLSRTALIAAHFTQKM